MADKTSASITVARRRADVMAVIADFPAYPQWVSAIRSAEILGLDESGRAAQVRIVLDAGVVKDTFVLSYRWDDDTAVWWQLAGPGSVISVMDGGYQLADADGQTEVTYELTVDVRIPMLGMLKRRAEQAIIDTALKGLKKRAETVGGDPT